MIACGYQFDLNRLGFLAPEVRARIVALQRVAGARPLLPLSRPRASTFVGYAAEHRFGPLSRFVLGAEFTATRVAAALGS